MTENSVIILEGPLGESSLSRTLDQIKFWDPAWVDDSATCSPVTKAQCQSLTSFKLSSMGITVSQNQMAFAAKDIAEEETVL